MRALWPPLDVIAGNLRESSPGLLHLPERNNPQSGDAPIPEPVKVPDFIQDKIRQRVDSRNAQFDTTPSSGQIWRFDGATDSLNPLCVLLNHKVAQDLWSGWMVSSETDYATNRDVLLESKDEPYDPVAAMVQTWNPVTVDIRKASRPLAHLNQSRLKAIAEMAQGQAEEGGRTRPGFVAPLKTTSGAIVLSGTPIGDATDPRNEYQSLFRAAALGIAHESRSAKVIPALFRQGWISNIGWGIAASLLLVQVFLIANQSREQVGRELSEYRAVTPSKVRYAYLEIYFKPDASELEIRKLLTRIDGTIIDGPKEFGQFVVRINSERLSDVKNQIHESGIVDSLDVKDNIGSGGH